MILLHLIDAIIIGCLWLFALGIVYHVVKAICWLIWAGIEDFVADVRSTEWSALRHVFRDVTLSPLHWIGVAILVAIVVVNAAVAILG